MSVELEIFRAGKVRDNKGREHSFTAEDIAAIAAAYDPAVHEAPLVVGHPSDNAPAYGWTKTLVAKGDTLVAVPHQVDPAFAELAPTHFKKKSASFYAPDSPANPKPGTWYLRHIGFLGAAPPAVKGLRDASFAADEAGVVEFSAWGTQRTANFFRRIREFFIEKFGAEDADRVLPQWDVENFEAQAAREIANEEKTQATSPAFNETQKGDQVTMADKTELEKQQAALTAREKDVADREAKIAQREVEAARTSHASFAEPFVAAGKLLPRQRAVVVELLTTLDKGGIVEFAEGEETVKKPAGELFKSLLGDLLGALPKQVDFSEQAREDGKTVASGAKEIAARAEKFRQDQAKLGIEISIVEAVNHVSKL